MKKAFFVAHRLPFPPNKGDKLRAYHILKTICESFETYLFCHLDDARDLEEVKHLDLPLAGVYFRFLPAWRRKIRCLKALPSGSLTVAYFYEKELQRKYDAFFKEKRPSLVFCSCAPAAEYVFRGPSVKETKLLLDFMDVDSEKWQAYANRISGPSRLIYALEAQRLRSYEKRIVEFFQRVFLVSEEEARLFRQKVSESPKISVLENGVDLFHFTPHYQSSLTKEGPVLVFTGAMDYWPNAEGVVWFVENCWPLIKKAFPKTVFYVVGKDPLPEVSTLAQKDTSIIVTGFVKDTRDYLALADICIAPLQLARGIQNKILEAAAMGKAIVATPQAAEGISLLEEKEILIAKNPQVFAEKIVELLRNPKKARLLGRKARLKMEKNYSWEKKLAPLKEYLSRI